MYLVACTRPEARKNALGYIRVVCVIFVRRGLTFWRKKLYWGFQSVSKFSVLVKCYVRTANCHFLYTPPLCQSSGQIDPEKYPEQKSTQMTDPVQYTVYPVIFVEKSSDPQSGDLYNHEKSGIRWTLDLIPDD